MPNSLESTLIQVARDFAQRAESTLFEPRWKRIQSLINQINEVDPGRYGMIINEINHLNGDTSIAIIDFKQEDNAGNSQQPFIMHASPKQYVSDNKRSIGFSKYDNEGRITKHSTGAPNCNEVDFIVSKLPDALPKGVYEKYADKFLSQDGQHPGFNFS